MSKKTHINIKTEKAYGLINAAAMVKIEGVWHNAVIYTDESGIMFCRTQKDFNDKFIEINPNQ